MTFIMLALSANIFAQEVSQLDSTTQSLAIDILNISTELETTRLLVTSFEIHDYDKKTIDRLDSITRERSEKIQAEYERFKKRELGRISKSSLDALLSAWNLQIKTTDKKLQEIRNVAETYSQNIESVNKEASKWGATKQVLIESESPIEIQEKVDASLLALKKAEERCNENLARLINIETKLGEVISIINDIMSDLNVAMEERSRQIFVQNAPVLWNVTIRSDSSDSTAMDTASINLRKKMDFLDRVGHYTEEKSALSIDFIESHSNTIYLHILLFILTLFLTYRYGNMEFEIEEGGKPSFAHSAMQEIKHHLFLTATYISILYSVLLYDYMPILITEVLVVTLILINMAILFRTQGITILKIGGILILISIAGQINIESSFNDLGYRFFILGKTLLAAWALKLFITYLNNHNDATSPEFWQRLNKFAKINYLFLIISLVTNVLGFVKMAELANLLVIQIIVVSFLFYGILITFNGWVALFFNVVWKPKQPGSKKFKAGLEKFALKIVNVIAILFWLQSILGTVGIYESIKTFVIDVFVTPLEVGTISISLEEVFFAFLVVVLTLTLNRFIRIVVTEGGLDRYKLQRGVPNAISLVVRYTLIVIGFLLALSVAGIDLTTFSLLAGALGIGIGFGLQNIISNFVSGLILVFERPLQEGDVVEVNSLLGIVKNIGVRSSNIRTYTGSEVVVPNESLISKELVNWTLSDPNKRLEIRVGVDYGTNPRTVISLLQEVAAANVNVQKDPAPVVFFDEFGDSSLNFRLLFWVHHTIALSVRSEVMVGVSDVLEANNINIPFPIRTLKMDNPEINDELKALRNKDQRRDEDIDATSKD